MKKFLATTVLSLSAVLSAQNAEKFFHIDFETYNASASYLTLMLIPATIALGYPIYKHISLLKKYKRIIYSAFFYCNSCCDFRNISFRKTLS